MVALTGQGLSGVFLASDVVFELVFSQAADLWVALRSVMVLAQGGKAAVSLVLFKCATSRVWA